MSDGTYSKEKITPTKAAKWLADWNTHNIPMDDRLVGAYATDMTNGRWRETGDGIKFATDGTLLDGQKRLAAIVRSGVTIEMMVVRNLDMEAQEVMDIGHHRKLSDVLHLRGELNAIGLSAIVRRAYMWEKSDFRTYSMTGGGTGLTIPPTHYQLLEYLAEHPDRPVNADGEPDRTRPPGLREAAKHANRISQRTGLPPSTAGLLWLLFERIDPDDNTAFWNGVISGVSLPSNSPIYQLREHREKDRRAARKDTKALEQAFVIKAWNLWREGAKVNLLKIIIGGAHPEPYPVPR